MSRLRATFRSTVTVLCIGSALALSGCADDRALLPVPTASQPCPPWVMYPANPYSNADSPYIGCTVALNLSANVARPSDLAVGRPLGPADGQRETLSVETYQQGKIKPFPSVTYGTTTSITSGGGGS